MHQLWDKLFKIIGDRFTEDVLRFIYPKKKLEVCGKFEQERIVLEYQVSDINLWVKSKAGKKLLNIEPYSEWTDKLPAEVFTKNALITRSLDHEYEVVTIVVLLETKNRVCKYEPMLDDELGNSHSFPVVSLDNVEEILEKCPPLAPFLIKVNLKKYKDKVISAVKGNTLLKLITVFALNKMGVPQEEAIKMTGLRLEEFKQALLEVPIMQDMAKEFEDEGRVKGGNEKAKAIAKNMLAENCDIAFIAKVTGLSIDEIRHLKA